MFQNTSKRDILGLEGLDVRRVERDAGMRSRRFDGWEQIDRRDGASGCAVGGRASPQPASSMKQEIVKLPVVEGRCLFHESVVFAEPSQGVAAE